MNPPFATVRTTPAHVRPDVKFIRHLVTIPHEIFEKVDIWVSNEANVGYSTINPQKMEEFTLIIVRNKDGQREFVYDQLRTLLAREIYNDFSALASLAKEAHLDGLEIYRDQKHKQGNNRYSVQDGIEYAAEYVFRVYFEKEKQRVSASATTGC